VPDWTLLTNHGHMLVVLSRSPDARIRDIADAIGITEGSAQRIVGELVEAGYLERRREGRRNVYSVNDSLPLRHPIERDHVVGDLLRAVS
jgi:DNA-binding MarR family transcriptional regulator